GVVTILPDPMVADTDAIDLGSATDAAADTLELSEAELDNITADRLLIGSDDAADATNDTGQITLTDAIDFHDNAKVTTLHLRTPAGVGTSGGSIGKARLAITADDDVTLDSTANDIDAMSVDINGAGNLTVVSMGDMLIDAIEGINGLNTSGGDIDVTINPDGIPSGDLSAVTADVDSNGGDITFTTTDGAITFAIDSVITSSGGDVTFDATDSGATLDATDGNIDVDSALVTVGGDVLATGTDGDVDFSGTIDTSTDNGGNDPGLDGGNVTIFGDNVAVTKIETSGQDSAMGMGNEQGGDAGTVTITAADGANVADNKGTILLRGDISGDGGVSGALYSGPILLDPDLDDGLDAIITLGDNTVTNYVFVGDEVGGDDIITLTGDRVLIKGTLDNVAGVPEEVVIDILGQAIVINNPEGTASFYGDIGNGTDTINGLTQAPLTTLQVKIDQDAQIRFLKPSSEGIEQVVKVDGGNIILGDNLPGTPVPNDELRWASIIRIDLTGTTNFSTLTLQEVDLTLDADSGGDILINNGHRLVVTNGDLLIDGDDIRLSDLTARSNPDKLNKGNITINSAGNIEFFRRDADFIIDSNGFLVMEDSSDYVATNVISINGNSATLTGTGPDPRFANKTAVIAGMQGGTLLTTVNTFTTQVYGNIETVPIIQLTRTGGNGSRGLVLDLTTSGVSNENGADAIAGAVPRKQIRVVQPILISTALKDALVQLGINARDLDSDELLEYLTGRSLYYDLPAEPINAADDQYTVATARIELEAATSTVAIYNSLFFSTTITPDGREERRDMTVEIADALQMAYDSYSETSAGQPFNATAFVAHVDATPGLTQAKAVLTRLNDLFASLDNLGLTPREKQQSQFRLLENLVPDGMNAAQLIEAINVAGPSGFAPVEPVGP
ncbi:MAG: beta strand repeat-containing protein, partial [Planctomycetota bacterium]